MTEQTHEPDPDLQDRIAKAVPVVRSFLETLRVPLMVWTTGLDAQPTQHNTSQE